MDRDEQIEVVDTILKGMALIIMLLPQNPQQADLVKSWVHETKSLITDMRNE